MSQSPLSLPATQNRGSGPALILLPVLALLMLSVFLAGCGGGGGEDEDVVLASVGQAEIMSSYYEDRLAKLKENELPRTEDGSILDMSQLEGKKKFLETLINKDVMVQTAESMGLDNDPAIANAKESLTSYEASLVLWDRVIRKPSNTISPEELEAFYAKFGSARDCNFLICNFEKDALAAREKARAGADWEDVAREYHDGGDPPNGRFEISIPFGRYNPDFENGVFNTEIGDVTPPILTVYGFWILKINGEKEGKKPPLEEAKAQILDITYNRKMAHLREEFKEAVLEKFELNINPDALWICYSGLPDGETLFKEGTQTPRTQEELQPLNIATEDMDLVFYSYQGRDGLKEYTLLDYKNIFDKMSVFQRPKDSEMMGGLRNKIEAEIGKVLLNFEAEDRGLYEDPEVVAKVDLKIEEMMVNKLYSEVIQIDDRIAPEQLDAFWAEHNQDYLQRESRDGRMVVCQNAELAAEARASITPETSWKDLLVTYGTDKNNKANSGKVSQVILRSGEPLSEALFSLQPDEVSDPFPVGDGRYAIVRLDSVTAERQLELDEVREDVGKRMREIRKEEAFQTMMAKWKESIPVTVYEENLAGLSSWQELTTVELPGTPVPRN